MHGEPKYFWLSWPAASQERLFRLALVGTVVATFAVSVGLKLFSGSLEQRIVEAREQYGRVVPIVEEVRALRAKQGDLVDKPVSEAVWAIIDGLGIEEQLTSFRATQLDEGLDAAQVTFKGLPLNRLMDFLRDLRDRASLQTPGCTLTRNPDDPRLADAHFVLAR
ncbi:hypothetical protein GM415_03950 [Pseudodesulfovibrio cashew]|uniref:Uncharacterized protein n=1 Tax=Pseudodesulfovibrio cashew TaxID=2678688 RepID=A0A6I6J8Z1_9BACT|nr:type II secretion system protein M [Pseudodesulfovibrio cashew]QGY39306.1 hypothetical protein GM415_03950 [Pseudodesulfovibrio cashew]